MRRTALAALCLTAVTSLAVTGCQGDDKTEGKSKDKPSAGQSDQSSSSSKPKEPFAGLTGGEIADRAVKATFDADSFRMKGDIPDDASGSTITMDMALDRKGDCAGNMSIGGEGQADLIKTGDTLYMKYDEDFLRAQSEGAPEAEVDATVSMLADKWTKMSAKGSDAKDFADFCDMDTVFGDADDAGSDATRGKTATVDGTPAITLYEKDGKESFTFYVATEGEPYVLRLVSTTPSDEGSLTFSDFDEPVPADKPTGDILDLDALGG
ncbi:lipoprotein [Streptomyces davaonensis JCM 4913]|uniref:Lipoprotein n=1 Tax=Streptomyces davaonensis (strain DSM 101723 / JCM 4913 / KCC S-0913 / 768) TaxID=1214101 RepID=K4R870_STRDJ|nr:hypothetical protein [Streptomyces davaonensis]CCK29553.1 lipoprotein [Streptomyces davaonensis JCM 4913]